MATLGASQPNRPHGQDEVVFQQLDDYPWDSDSEFQSGLLAILGSDPAPDQAEHLTLRARCFYFSRKHDIPIDFDAYRSWRSQHSLSSISLPNGNSSVTDNPTSSYVQPSPSSVPLQIPDEPKPAMNNSEPPAPYPTSFSQIVELITNGQPIPGIKEVPETVLEGQASHPTTAKRKKPWENDNADGGEEASVTINSS